MALDANAAFTDRHRLRTVHVADPGAGNPANYQVAANEVIQIVGVRLELTTSALPAERRVYMYILDPLGANPIEVSVSHLVQNNNLTWDYWFSCGIAPVDASHELNVFDPLACGLQLFDQERFSITALSMVGGDVISDIYLRFYQWKED
jgi:hypothetical protein